MPWQLLRLQFSPVTTDEVDELEQLLLDAGAQSVTLADAQDQPLFQIEPGATPLWDTVSLSGMFAADTDLGPVKDRLQQRLTITTDELEITRLEDQDWEKTWMDRFQPMRFGERLWICPSWLSPPDPAAVTIMLDPGMAFGTGTHPTTALCLEWLDQHNLDGKVMVDFGCGSGVLAIAAALLGAAQVLAVDNDPQAITATEANRRANNLDAALLQCFLPEQFPPADSPLPADVLVANILAGPLAQLAPRFATLVKPGGDLVLSGILPDQAEPLREVYRPWFNMAKAVTRDQWTRLAGSRR